MRILLIGDVGIGENGWYHVGDESMLRSNYIRIKKRFPNADITILSRSKSHPLLNVHEVTDSNLLPGGQYKTQAHIRTQLHKLIRSQDLIWFSGGGNLNSLFPDFLVHRVTIAKIAQNFKIPMVATGQTIGPLSNQHDITLIRTFFNAVNTVVVREHRSIDELKIHGLPTEQIKTGWDDAFFIKPSVSLLNQHLSNHSALRIGLSLRDYDKSETIVKIQESLQIFLDSCSKNITLYLIPHIFDDLNNFDIKAMQEFSNLTNCLVVTNKIIRSYPSHAPDEVIHAFTGAMDVMVTTRYHGVIFGLAQNVPTLALYADEYYKIKNLGAYERVCDTLAKKYCFDLRSKTIHDIANSLAMIIREHNTVRQTLAHETSKRKRIAVLSNPNERESVLFE